MKVKRSIYLCAFMAIISISHSAAQEIGIGQWRDHLPYNSVIAVAEADNIIYAATPFSLFYLDRDDNSLDKLTKINGLSDVGISSIEYNSEYKTLVIAYTNANIDLLKNGVITNLSDIKRKQILGNKTINSIRFIDNKAYLSCGFGVLVLDIDKMVFPEPTYYIGAQGVSNNVFDIAYNEADSTIYAATETGIFSANYYAPNLAYFAEWTREFASVLPPGPFNHITAFNGRVYTNRTGGAWATDYMFVKVDGEWQAFEPTNNANRHSIKVCNDRLVISLSLAVDIHRPDGSLEYRIWTYNPGSVMSNDALLSSGNTVWIADNQQGLIKVTNVWDIEKYMLNGPEFPDAFALSSGKNDVWAVSGGRNSAFNSLFRIARFASFIEGKWNTIDSKKDPNLFDYRDVVAVAVNPQNHKNVFLGTLGYGLLEYTDGVFVNHYTSENSSLQISVLDPNRTEVGGLAFDDDNNLWVVNSMAASLLSVKKPSGEWKSLSLGSVASGVEGAKLVIDQQGQKWILGRNLSLFVFSDNQTIDNPADDQAKRLTSTPGNGAIPGEFVRSIAVDKDGLVWLGTNKGVAVFYSPQNVFSGQNFDAQKVLINQDGQGQYLLEAETVTAIAVDGDNRKWFGTEKAGLFLMSADGTKELLHFTEENSPLLSNTISDLTITEVGELFIATPKGIISYRTGSVPTNPTLSEVVVYPNPVRESFTGDIAVKGLVDQSSVNITDIAGNVVFSALADGGQVLWNGHNFDGVKAKTGVYLVFITNKDGSKKSVAKIMVVN